MPSEKPLIALVGNLWVPVWAVRPGSYKALAGVANVMPLWLALHSRNSDYYKPCYASRETLGATIGVSRNTVGRQLKRLRGAGLLFVVERPPDGKTHRRRPPARWALDPFAAEVWREEVEAALARVAEDDGHDGRWFTRAVTALDAFDRRSRLLAARIAEDMPTKPRRRRRKKKGREATDRDGPGGGIYTTGERATPSPARLKRSVKSTSARC